MTPCLRPAIVLAATLALAQTAIAQSSPAPSTQIEAALQAAERGTFDASQYPQLDKHPLLPWIEFAQLRRGIDTLPLSQGQDFLKRHDGQAVADTFRPLWLTALAKRQDWTGFLAAWKDTDNTALRCSRLVALNALGRADRQWDADAATLWRNGGKSLPEACTPVFTTLSTRGALTPALRWERFDAAAGEGEAGLMRSIARNLPASESALANDYAAFIDAPHARALEWPKTERSRRIAAHGLARLARKDPDAAERLLPQYVEALGLGEAERGQVLHQIALWTVASYLPDSARRLSDVPESAYDERLHEWRAREAMARGDWPAALAAIRKMPAAQREDSRWRYFEARLAEKTGEKAEAQRLFREAAKAPTFHGFLAADWLDLPYALCPWKPNDSTEARNAVARDPAIVRAMELWQLERPGWATAEWRNAMSRFNDTQRRIAVEVARDHGWYDRAVFSLGRNPDEQRLYELRFPLHHDAAIRRESLKHGIDPAWVAAEIRAESVFNPRARSGANAMGLMQVLPATAAAVAKRIGLSSYTGASSLYDSDTNIAIGTAYLREMEDKYGLPYIAIAAYNAGPTPTARWQSQRPHFDPDFWIETISYRETREYVARVLAFSAIYDWRLNGDALPVTDRMLGRTDGPRKAFVCPAN